MTIDATFWVMVSFFLFIGLLIYFQIPQKIKITLEENISSIIESISGDSLNESSIKAVIEDVSKKNLGKYL